MRWAQARLRGGRLGWLFVAPNLAIFGVFTFLPIAIDFGYAATGGTDLLLSRAALCRARQHAPSCSPARTISTRTAARIDLFWYGVWNTLRFVVLQVGLMIVFSLLTALVLNQQDHRPRLLPRGVLLSGAALAGGRRADLEMDAAARRRAQCGARGRRALHPVDWLLERGLGVLLDGLRQHLGAYGVLHADPARRIAGDPARHLRGGGDGCGAAVPRVPPPHAAAADAEPARRVRARR